MTVTAIPKHKPIIGKPQKKGIRNVTHCRGAHNPRTEPNESNCELGLLYYVRTAKLCVS